MNLNDLFRKPEASISIVENYILKQNEFLQKEIAEINKTEEDDNYKAIADANLRSQLDLHEHDVEKRTKIEDLRIKITLLENANASKENISLNDLQELSNLYIQLERLEDGFSETDIMMNNAYLSHSKRDYLAGEFSSIQQNNNLVLVYSQFETSLSEICATLKNKLKIPIYANELQGTGIEVYKKYLNKFCFINSDFFKSKNWHYLDTVRLIRNSIVHEGNNISRLQREDSKLVNAQICLEEIKDLEGVTIMQSRMFSTSPEFVLQYIDQVKIFYLELRIQLAKNRKLFY